MKATYKLYPEDTQIIINHYFPNGIDDESNEFIYSPLYDNNDDYDNYNGEIIYCTKTKIINLFPYSGKSQYSIDTINNTLVYTGPYKSIFTHYSVDMEYGCEGYPQLLDRIVLFEATFESTEFDTGIFSDIEEYRKASVLAILEKSSKEKGKFQSISEMRNRLDSIDLYLLEDEILEKFIMKEDEFYNQYDFSKIDYLQIRTNNNNLLICLPSKKEYFFCRDGKDDYFFDNSTSVENLLEVKLTSSYFGEFYNAILNWHSRCQGINIQKELSYSLNELKK